MHGSVIENSEVQTKRVTGGILRISLIRSDIFSSETTFQKGLVVHRRHEQYENQQQDNLEDER